MAHGFDPETWVYCCEGHNDPLIWTSPAALELAKESEGLAAELELLKDLSSCIYEDDPWIEHGVVEYRYSQTQPEKYFDVLIPRFGHRVLGAQVSSTSTLIAGVLMQLQRDGLLAWRCKQATGFWSYVGFISYWARVPYPPEDRVLSWEAFASSRGVDPGMWTLERA
jgi:hypothetical protein